MEQKQLRILQGKKTLYISSLFSALVALLPVLASYASGIPGLTFADLCLVFFAGMAMLTKRTLNCYKVQVNSLVFGFAALISLSFIACLAGFPSSALDVAIRTIRYSFYIIVLFTAGKKILDVGKLIRNIKSVSFIGSIFILFQAIMYYGVGIVVRGYLPFFNLYLTEYSDMDYAAFYEQFRLYRPTSFFLEPAHYARYCIVGIVLFLFAEDTVDNKSIIQAAICSVGVIASTSSQGYFLLAIILCLFLFTRAKDVKSRMIKALMQFVILIFPIVILLLLQIPVISRTIERTLGGNILNPNSALGARLGGFVSYFELPFVNKLIGTGFGNVPDNVWLSSAAYWLYGSGIIVFLIYVYFMFRAFFRLDRVGKYILFIIGFLFVTDDSFYSYMIVLYFSLILFEQKRRRT